MLLYENMRSIGQLELIFEFDISCGNLRSGERDEERERKAEDAGFDK